MGMMFGGWAREEEDEQRHQQQEAFGRMLSATAYSFNLAQKVSTPIEIKSTLTQTKEKMKLFDRLKNRQERGTKNPIPANATNLEVFHVDTEKSEAYIGFDQGDNFNYVQVPYNPNTPPIHVDANCVLAHTDGDDYNILNKVNRNIKSSAVSQLPSTEAIEQASTPSDLNAGNKYWILQALGFKAIAKNTWRHPFIDAPIFFDITSDNLPKIVTLLYKVGRHECDQEYKQGIKKLFDL